MAFIGYKHAPPWQRPLLVWNGKPVRAKELVSESAIDEAYSSKPGVSAFKPVAENFRYIDLAGKEHRLLAGKWSISLRRSGRRLYEIEGEPVERNSTASP